MPIEPTMTDENYPALRNLLRLVQLILDHPDQWNRHMDFKQVKQAVMQELDTAFPDRP